MDDIVNIQTEWNKKVEDTMTEANHYLNIIGEEITKINQKFGNEFVVNFSKIIEELESCGNELQNHIDKMNTEKYRLNKFKYELMHIPLFTTNSNTTGIDNTINNSNLKNFHKNIHEIVDNSHESSNMNDMTLAKHMDRTKSTSNYETDELVYGHTVTSNLQFSSLITPSKRTPIRNEATNPSSHKRGKQNALDIKL